MQEQQDHKGQNQNLTVLESTIITPIRERHINRFLDTKNNIVGEKQYLAMDTPPPKERAISYLSNVIEKEFTFYILMENEKVIGWCDIIPKHQPFFAHAGVLAMGTLKQYRGKSLGEQLIRKAIKTAFKKGLTRIELLTYTDNKPAINLYKELGFKTEGKLINDAIIDGQYKNSYLMALLDQQQL